MLIKEKMKYKCSVPLKCTFHFKQQWRHIKSKKEALDILNELEKEDIKAILLNDDRQIAQVRGEEVR